MTADSDDNQAAPRPGHVERVNRGDDPTATVSWDSQRSPEESLEDIHLPGYVLTALLGRGAYGQVWQAVRVGAGQDVAVKIFTSPGKLDWRYLQREIDRLLRVAEHPHIVTLLDANLQHQPPFYAMALLRRGSLADLIRGGKPADGVEQAAAWFEQIVKALDFAHGKGLLHCDLKPANVLLDEEDNVRLVDFGQSQLRGEAAHVLGTLSYMAPEQAVVAGEHTAPPDPSVSWDIYSLGATMYALLCGSPPHSQPDLHRTLTEIPDVESRLAQYRQYVLDTPITPLRYLNPAVDRDLAEIVECCLSPDPGARYHNIGQVAEDLRHRRDHKPLYCHPPGGWYRLKKFVRRNLGMVVISFMALLALATLAATLSIQFNTVLERLESEKTELSTKLEEARSRLEGLGPQPRSTPSDADEE